MGVTYTGDLACITQDGARERFEAALNVAGRSQDTFKVDVIALPRSGPGFEVAYCVLVIDINSGRLREYTGGGGGRWTDAFAQDLAAGMFG